MNKPNPPVPLSPRRVDLQKAMVIAEKEVFKKAFNKEAFSIDEGGDGGLPRSPQKSKTSGLYPPKQWNLMINTIENGTTYQMMACPSSNGEKTTRKGITIMKIS